MADKEMTDLEKLIEESRAIVDKMTPEEKAAMIRRHFG
jgi:hypothetical protein